MEKEECKAIIWGKLHLIDTLPWEVSARKTVFVDLFDFIYANDVFKKLNNKKFDYSIKEKLKQLSTENLFGEALAYEYYVKLFGKPE
jgi:hypothetical protein